MEKTEDRIDEQIVIRHLGSGIVTFSVPFGRNGVLPFTMHIGGRTTAIALPNRQILVYVSHPLTTKTSLTLADMGEVMWLVTPDGEHGMYFAQWAAAFPEAKTIGVPRYREKLPDVAWTGFIGEGGGSDLYGFEDHITIHRVSAHANDELVLYHRSSKTLVEADMLFNLPPTEQYSNSGGIPFSLRLLNGGRAWSPGRWFHSMFAKACFKDAALMKRELVSIDALDIDRIIPCHGDVIDSNGKAAWDLVWEAYK